MLFIWAFERCGVVNHMNAFLWRTRLSYIPPWQELLLDFDQAHHNVLNDIQNLFFLNPEPPTQQSFYCDQSPICHHISPPLPSISLKTHIPKTPSSPPTSTTHHQIKFSLSFTKYSHYNELTTPTSNNPINQLSPFPPLPTTPFPRIESQSVKPNQPVRFSSRGYCEKGMAWRRSFLGRSGSFGAGLPRCRRWGWVCMYVWRLSGERGGIVCVIVG